MQKLKAGALAREQLKQGHNCCQAVMYAAGHLLEVELSDDVLTAGSLFAHGMDRGCVCGALVGMVMFSGIMEKRYGRPSGVELPARLEEEFIKNFGSTCCRSIRKSRNPILNIGNRACLKLTEQAAEMLVAVWEVQVHGKQP